MVAGLVGCEGEAARGGAALGDDAVVVVEDFLCRCQHLVDEDCARAAALYQGAQMLLAIEIGGGKLEGVFVVVVKVTRTSTEM